MLDMMGVAVSALPSPFGELFGGVSEDDAMLEFDDIKARLRACESDYTRFQKEKSIIPSKLAHMKNSMSTDDKMYAMIAVLETEWISLSQRIQRLADNQSSIPFTRAGYSGW